MVKKHKISKLLIYFLFVFTPCEYFELVSRSHMYRSRMYRNHRFNTNLQASCLTHLGFSSPDEATFQFMQVNLMAAG